MTKYVEELTVAHEELNELADKLRERTGKYTNEFTTLAYGRVMFAMNILGAYVGEVCDLEMVASTLDHAEEWLEGVTDHLRENEPADYENFPAEDVEQAFKIVSKARDVIEEDVPRPDDLTKLLRALGAL